MRTVCSAVGHAEIYDRAPNLLGHLSGTPIAFLTEPDPTRILRDGPKRIVHAEGHESVFEWCAH